MRELGYIRLTSELNVYKHPEGKAYIMVYVDDLLFVGETEEINNIFNKMQEKMLLRATGEASQGNTISFLGRKITNKGDHFDLTSVLMMNTWSTSSTKRGSNVTQQQRQEQLQEKQTSKVNNYLTNESISNFDDWSENYNCWHTPGQTSAVQQKNLQEHFKNQPLKTRRSCDI